jgi:CRP/FNR family cyclic AMP-dependent transcriptional regulator
MSMLSNLDLIRRVPLFSMLTVDQAQAIADSVVKRRFRRGELVVEQGRKSNALFILLNGRARVLTADTRGREVILAVLESGDYVGEMSLIDNEPHSATVRAEIQTDMLVLARADFARCLPENSTCPTASCAAWCAGCATPTGRSNRWRCWTCTAAWPARCWTWPRRSRA